MASQPAVINAIDFLYNAFTTSGPNAAGAGTITLKAPLPPTAAGLPIIINTSAPITVGGDSNSETVTPTAVAYDQFGNVNITATFANAHGVGEPVTAASFGMQEAASYALSKGGGLVALSHQWFAATGLSHANAITFLETFLSLSANITILDYSGVSGSAYSYTAAAGSNYAATAYHLY
jgi:hypothetical protein